MNSLDIPKGAAVLLGAPAKPMPSALSTAIGDVARNVAGVREAYLPQCFVDRIMEAPAQVLVVVLDAGVDCQKAIAAIHEGLKHVLPQGMQLDIWPMNEGDSLLSTVRGTRTHIHCPPPSLPEKPWWRIFG